MRCDFSISSEEIPKDDIDGLLDGVGIAILQGSDVLHVYSCDDLLQWVILNRKYLFEGPNQLFVLFFHCSDDELNSAIWNNQKSGV